MEPRSAPSIQLTVQTPRGSVGKLLPWDTVKSPEGFSKVDPNRYTRLANLAWSQSVFIQFSFCKKKTHRFMKPLLLSSIKNQTKVIRANLRDFDLDFDEIF